MDFWNPNTTSPEKSSPSTTQSSITAWTAHQSAEPIGVWSRNTRFKKSSKVRSSAEILNRSYQALTLSVCIEAMPSSGTTPQDDEWLAESTTEPRKNTV